MRCYHEIFSDIAAPERLFRAWEAFHRGKTRKPDVQRFERHLEENIFALHRALRDHAYRHGPYAAFTVCDPKPRRIHKASVRDRVVHHAVFAALEPVFEPAFYAHSYACRRGRGTHRAVRTLHTWLGKASGNGHRPCFVLQCDVHRFFASVAHPVLLNLLARRVRDDAAMKLIAEIVGSFRSEPGSARGLPLGNLTSQLFANVYLAELDAFVKHRLGVRRYVRFADDFAIAASSRGYLETLIGPIRAFLRHQLFLDLHPRKVTIRTFRQGIDFLGYVLLPHCRVLRTKTKRRMLRRLRDGVAAYRAGTVREESIEQPVRSYLGMLSHADSYGLRAEISRMCRGFAADGRSRRS
jgi:retron-type reverse transcriptase